MDIFNGNRKLEEIVMYALDWGVFLRKDLDGPIAPFMFLYDGKERQTRLLMTEGDPVEYALKVLAKEDKPFQQFVIGMEGYLGESKEQKFDAIIVQGFDKTQPKGVELGQMFEPKEKNGTFKKIDRVTFLGHPELPVSLDINATPDYAVEEVGFSSMSLKFGEGVQYLAFFTHDNPSAIANTIKRFLRSKFSDKNPDAMSGRFELQITPGVINHEEFLKYLVLEAIKEEKHSSLGQAWEQKSGQKILVNCNYGDTAFLKEFEKASEKKEENPPQAAKPELTNYTSHSLEQLEQEFHRLRAIPNGRTNISVLTAMSELIKEYENRGMPMPDGRPKSTPKEEKKPWWKLW